MTDSRLQPALQAAIARIQATAQAVADQVANALGLAAVSAASNTLRKAYMTAQFDLQRKQAAFNLTFGNVLRDKVMQEALPGVRGQHSLAATDWASLSLVDDAEVEAQVSAERLALEVEHECEWELRELAAYTGSLLGLGHADQARNPLRPEMIGKALFRGIETVSDQPELRKLLARELSHSLAQAMRACYQSIVEDLRRRGVQPVGLNVKQVEGPGNEMAREAPRETQSGYQSAVRRSEAEAAKALSAMFGMAMPQGLHDLGTHAGSGPGSLSGMTMPDLASGLRTGASTSGAASGLGSGYGDLGSQRGAPAQGSDAQLTEVIRRLAFLTSGYGDLGGEAPTKPASLSGGALRPGAPERRFTVTGGGGYGSSGHGGLSSGHHLQGGVTGYDALTGLMAANLIHQHREELRRASTGALDHMVIDVVGALFDQVLSDPKVAPAMARQIARLQLPVLRAALKDVGFFSSRRHPVRRFVNRIASLAAAYDDFDEGLGKDFLDKVRSLVQQIVEGDFDQMELYDSKLAELEALIQQQTAREAPQHAQVAALLDDKETELRIQQRYMRELQAHLAPLALHEFLREFLSQVWSQVQVLAVKREGPDSALAKRVNALPRELVFSVQPKGTPQLRKEFLLKLPQLMKDLNEGLALIRWPEAAKKDFLAKLLPAHAESLKGQPLTDFEQRQLSHQLAQVEKVAIPKVQDVARDSSILPLAADDAIEPSFSPEEMKQVGLVEESAIDWDGKIDIDLDQAADSTPAELDVNLDSPAPPSSGIQLMHHVQPGIAYRMHLDKGWQKVRLNWASPGRAFFVFSYGRKHPKTLSLSARMLARMCETGRFKAFEQTELIERATARARKQLAELTAAASKH